MLKKHFAVVTAAAMVVVGMALTAPAQQANDQQTVQRTETERQTSNSVSTDRTEISRALADVVAAATSGDADISMHVSESDRPRLAQNAEQGRDEVRQAAQRVREAFRAKYNQDFNLAQNQQMIFNEQFVQLSGGGEAQQASGQMDGEVHIRREGDNQRPAIPGGMAGQSIGTGAINQSREHASGGAPADTREDHMRSREMEGGIAGQSPRRMDEQPARTGGDTGDGARASTEMRAGDVGAEAEARTDASHGQAGAHTEVRTRPEIPGGMAGQSVGTGDVTIAEGQSRMEGEARMAGDRMAADRSDMSMQQRMHITIPASHGMPQTQVPMVREGTEWRVDLPSAMDGQRLNQRLAKHLSAAADSANDWPAEATEAYRAISHHVLMALTDRGS